MKFKGNFLKVLGGFVFGTATTMTYNYYNPGIIVSHAKDDQKFGFNLIKSLISKDQVLNDAVAVEATKSATQFGKEFYNNITPEGRRSIIAHPYDKQGSGVSVTVSYIDSTTGERQLMLMEKLKVRNKAEEGFAPQYDQIGGYTHGAGVEGTKKTTLSFAEGEAKDAAEDANTETGVVINLSYSSTSLNTAVQYTTKKDLEEIGEAIAQYNVKIVKKNPYIKNFNPNDIKDYLKSQALEYTRDYNAIDTAIREFREETGYNGIITPEMIREAYTIDNYGTTNVANLHTKVSHYWIDLGTLPKAPTIYESSFKSEREINSFQANGTEIGRLTWVSTNELKSKDDSSLWFQDKPIRFSYIPVLNNIIRELRDKELQETSKGVVNSHDNIAALVKHFQLQQNLSEFSGEFGVIASQKHRIDKCIAQKIGDSSVINSNSLSNIFEQCHEGINLKYDVNILGNIEE
ncbi:hypothetical protein Trichorick_00552 [Candidatus Trichorickettsia mobilis]|uniref:Uncharacterized protein n=1 Tax=Candidatus Trichorickettsia mobilis TaxID=1346319 RepID=A0ABZ0UUK0_9RICK|nr:hypothetical protein [Candidatus Trichorickettsia mobilis]WPY00668.1 hypothetical protein Trichorick_00552 [Candidatus Trichorickettsia mobilis]